LGPGVRGADQLAPVPAAALRLPRSRQAPWIVERADQPAAGECRSPLADRQWSRAGRAPGPLPARTGALATDRGGCTPAPGTAAPPVDSPRRRGADAPADRRVRPAGV